MPCPNGVMRSCTTRWRRWFCSAVRNGLGGGQTHNQCANVWQRGAEFLSTRWTLAFLSTHHNSVWRDFKDCVSFSWHAICKTDLLIINISKNCRLQILQILINVCTFKQSKLLNPELVKRNSAKTFTNIKQVLHIKRHGLNSTNSVNVAYGHKKKINLD